MLAQDGFWRRVEPCPVCGAPRYEGTEEDGRVRRARMCFCEALSEKPQGYSGRLFAEDAVTEARP